MRFRVLSALLVVSLLTGCPFEKNDPKTKAKGKHETDKPPIPTKDESGDVAFQGFIGRLQTAVRKKDVPTLSSMMAPDFGYRWDPAPQGEDPFIYWDRNRLWGELANLLSEKWVPYDGFMVVPPRLAVDSNYNGFRAGVRMINGAWRFAYFVPAPPAEAAEPAAPASPAPTSF